MKRICCYAIVCLLVSCSLVFAADFWESKDYSAWDEKEVSKMLENSPWAKKVRIRENKSGGGFGGGFGGFGGGPGGGFGGGPGGPGGPGGGPSAPVVSDSGNAADSGSDSGPAPAPAPAPAAKSIEGEASGSAAKSGGGDGSGSAAPPKSGPGGFGGGFGGGAGGPVAQKDLLGGLPMVVMRWQSALPVKQAMAKFRFQDEVKTSKEAADSLNRQESVHILGIVGMPGRVQSYKAEDIMAKSSLIIEDRPDIKPTQVIPQQEGATVGLYIIFPKFNEDGTPVISLQDKEIEVTITVGRYDVIKKFGLKDMVYQGKLDF